jgi:hypothetical protein
VTEGTLPRIAWDSLLVAATLTTAASNVAGSPLINVRDWRPWSFWRPTGGGPHTFDADFGSTKTVNGWALAGHDASGVVSMSTWNGSAWVLHSQVTAAGDGLALYVTGADVATTKVRFSFATLSYLSVAYAGKDLVLPEGIAPGWTDPAMAPRAKTTQETSRGGQWLGNSVEMWEANLSISLSNVDVAWARTYWIPFLRKCSVQPFFLHWNTVDAPASACFCSSAQFGDSGYSGRELVNLSVSFDADTGFDRRLSP